MKKKIYHWNNVKLVYFQVIHYFIGICGRVESCMIFKEQSNKEIFSLFQWMLWDLLVNLQMTWVTPMKVCNISSRHHNMANKTYQRTNSPQTQAQSEGTSQTLLSDNHYHSHTLNKHTHTASLSFPEDNTVSPSRPFTIECPGKQELVQWRIVFMWNPARCQSFVSWTWAEVKFCEISM